MRKGIFLLEDINQKKIDQILKLKPDEIFTDYKHLQKDACQELQKNGVKFYAEVGLFVGEEWWRKYPDSRPLTQDGKPFKKNHWYAGVCPNHPQVRKEKLDEIKTLVTKLDINGLWLDFVRYPCHWEKVRSAKIKEYCFCQNCLKKFKQEMGGKPEGEEWIQWKCHQITDFVAEVRNLISQSGKNIELGIFSVPWKDKEFKGAIRKIIGQDFGELARHIDVFSPMTYQKFCGKNIRWIGEMSRYMAGVTDKPVLPIVQTENRAGKINREEFRQEIVQATHPPSKGVVVFFLEDLLKDKDKTEIVKEIFR